MEWVFLVFAAAGILVPLLLLCGFAGCGRILELEGTEDELDVPRLRATAIATDQIRLEWESSLVLGVEFIVSMLGPEGSWNDGYRRVEGVTELVAASLREGTTYFFRVRSRFKGSGTPGTVEGEFSNLAAARTLQWKTAYERPLTLQDARFPGDCLVQRIDRGLLPASGPVTKLRLTLRGSPGPGGASLEIAELSVSHAAPAGLAGNPAPDPWDSAPPLRVLGPWSLPGDGAALAPIEFDFAFRADADLLIAFDIAAGNATPTRKATLAGDPSTCYRKNDLHQAAVENRAPFNTVLASSIYLIEKIEMLTG